MDIAGIQQFLDRKTSTDSQYVKIAFRDREPIFGLFVRGHHDYEDLKSKNFWRIVPRSRFDAYQQTGDIALAKIFNGHVFSRLTILKESFE